MDYKTPPRRVRRHRSALSIFLTILIIAAVTVGVIAAGIYFSGIRYITSNTEDGLTIKYFGRVDKDGTLLTGKLYYSDGMTAEVDMQKNSIVYSNGDIYEGGISDLKKERNRQNHLRLRRRIRRRIRKRQTHRHRQILLRQRRRLRRHLS